MKISWKQRLGIAIKAIGGRVVTSGYRTAAVQRSLQRRGQRYFDSWRWQPSLEDSDVLVAGLNAAENALVGPGVRPMPDTGDMALDERLTLLWGEWSRMAGVDGCHFDDVARLAVRCWQRDGEVFLVLADGPKIQVLESCDLPDQTAGNIVGGVEVDGLGMPIAYHFAPNSGDVPAIGVPTRVPAERVLHVKTVTRARQVRGESLWATAWGRISDLDAYDKAEQGSAKVAAAGAVMIKTNGASLPGITAAGELTDAEDRGGDDELVWPEEGGLVFHSLQPGEDVEQVTPQRPNPELTRYRAAMLRQIAATASSDYTSISRDVPGSYSAARQLSVLAGRDYDALFAIFRRQALEPLWRVLVPQWAASGMVRIMPNRRLAALNPRMRRPREGWIDPNKQATAFKTLVELGVLTPDQVAEELSLKT